jgi:flagellar secretion chaperone FliS
MKDYATVKQAYTESSVMTAPPEKLVVMLYDGAIRFLRQSAVAMRAGNREVAVNRIHRADAIIDELNFTLDMSHGQISTGLRSIYLFSKRHLSEAIVERDPERVDEVIRLLSELREAWQQIAGQAAAASDAAAAAG